MDIMITYDVDHMHNEIKTAMKNLGYQDNWKYDGRHYYLPNTTLWKADISCKDSIEDLKGVIRHVDYEYSTKVILQRAISTICDKWDGIPGKPYVI
jgi:hypothetical protein